MRTFRLLAYGAGAALSVALAPGSDAHAQPFPTLAPGQSVQGRLESGDPVFASRGRFRVYQIQVQAGRRYVVTLDSDDFDAYLSLGRVVGGITDYLRHDDDGGEGLNARLRFTVPATGTYLIVAQSLGSGGTGAYTLALDTVRTTPAATRDIELGQTVRGTLSETDAEFDDDEGFYQLFRFRGTAGQRVRVRVESEDFYPVMEIGMMDDGAFIPLEDAGSGYGTFALAVLPSAGTYYVRAGGSGVGSYSVTVEERVLRPIPARAIGRGEPVAGALGPGDAELDDGRWVDAYSFTGRAGEEVTITLRSDDFDAYLFLGRMQGAAFEQLAYNDDSMEEEGLNSRIDFTLPADGEYVIHATSFSAGSEGAYVLRLEP